ncbi:MAG: hypothetical protein U0670_21775 [Anaerolineae bacterium]
MELIQFARIFLRRWWLIAIPVAITAALAIPALLNRAPATGGFSTRITYSAAPNYDAIPRTDGDYQDIWLSSELAVNAFTDWVRGGAFKDEIAAALAGENLTIDPAQLGISADNARSVGRLYLSYPDAEALQSISDAAITVMRTRSQDYFPQLGGAPANVTVLDQAPISAAPPPVTDRLGPFLRIGLGLLAGLGLALLAHYLDPSLRRREDFDALHIPLLSSIPKR